MIFLKPKIFFLLNGLYEHRMLHQLGTKAPISQPIHKLSMLLQCYICIWRVIMWKVVMNIFIWKDLMKASQEDPQ